MAHVGSVRSKQHSAAHNLHLHSSPGRLDGMSCRRVVGLGVRQGAGPSSSLSPVRLVQHTVIKSIGNFTLLQPATHPNTTPQPFRHEASLTFAHSLFSGTAPLRSRPQPPHACSTSPTRQVSTGRLMTSILDPRSCCMRPSQLPGLDHGVLLSWRLVASPADPPPQSPVCSACSVGLFSSGSRRHDARLVGFGPKRGHRVPTWYLSMFPLVPSRDLDAFCTTLGSLVVSGRLSSCNSSPLVLREGCAEALSLPHKQQGYTRSGEAKVQACCVPAELLREIHPQPEEALPPLLVLTLVFSAAVGTRDLSSGGPSMCPVPSAPWLSSPPNIPACRVVCCFRGEKKEHISFGINPCRSWDPPGSWPRCEFSGFLSNHLLPRQNCGPLSVGVRASSLTHLAHTRTMC
ncbi:uncharacterized protein IWZ02DRAFT_166098 [Phyllosticta citriasiana]|uniref:uncharacterized protein n=1 Tax=Phyllosticta citriasiana TaxID=595635 RepID=UPI0030FD793C